MFLTAFVAVTLAWRSARRSGELAERRRIDAERNEREANEQRRRAVAGFAKARAAVDEYLNKVTDSEPLTAPGLQSLRRDLLNSGLGFYQDFLKEHAGDPALRFAEADVQFRAGKIISQINPGAAARSAFDRAGALFEALYRDRPDDADVLAGLAEFLAWDKHPMRAIALLDPLTQRHPENARYLRMLLDALNAFAIERSNLDDPEETLKTHLRASRWERRWSRVSHTLRRTTRGLRRHSIISVSCFTRSQSGAGRTRSSCLSTRVPTTSGAWHWLPTTSQRSDTSSSQGA